MKPIDFQAARVMTAFGVPSWGTSSLPGRTLYFGNSAKGEMIHLEIDDEQSVFWSLEIGEGQGRTQLFVCLLDGETSLILDNPRHKDILAQGLYCLNFNHPNVLEQIAHALSMHEKIELRLDFPREFWPDAWEREINE